jgi:hypothetical protein
MAALQAKAHLLEARYTIVHYPFALAKPKFDSAWAVICKAHKTDSATFRKSYEYYAARPPEMDAIYALVVDSLGVEESRRQAQKLIP